MARYTDAVCRICRREGDKLFLKGDRCYTDKCAVQRRSYAPGQHGQGRKKLSEYGLQLREKQKAKRYYGLLENQFEHYFDLAAQKSGITGENLLQILESRLDNIAYRAGFGMSRPEARQLVTHAHFTVNGKKVNVPSYLCKPGDVIAIREKSMGSDKFKTVLEINASRPALNWLSVDRAKGTATVVNLPSRSEVDLQVQEHLIVELYSK
ncbi:MAG: 30S ribosomal protein S4 [Clostridium sp. SCN 57-10]|nr:MAG: 30S ribosomal protein S4 [Clostridium sp. SCN 57-10]